jgi:lipoyl(octanoyl) transferase
MVSRRDIKSSLHSPTPVEWEVSSVAVRYPEALTQMDSHVAAIAQALEPERIWLLEHPSIYTAGTSAKREDLVDAGRFPVFETGRGGQYTYHGPGQRVAYVLLNLAKRGGDVRAFVAALENWLIATLAEFDVLGERREDRVGIWVRRGAREDKIAALGIRVRKGITFHGLSFNVNPDLSHFSGIVPCGVVEHGVTSLADLGIKASMAEVDLALRKTFEKQFGPVVIL